MSTSHQCHPAPAGYRRLQEHEITVARVLVAESRTAEAALSLAKLNRPSASVISGGGDAGGLRTLETSAHASQRKRSVV